MSNKRHVKPRQQLLMLLLGPVLLSAGTSALANTTAAQPNLLISSCMADLKFAHNSYNQPRVMASTEQDAADQQAPKERPLPFTVDTKTA